MNTTLPPPSECDAPKRKMISCFFTPPLFPLPSPHAFYPPINSRECPFLLWIARISLWKVSWQMRFGIHHLNKNPTESSPGPWSRKTGKLMKRIKWKKIGDKDWKYCFYIHVPAWLALTITNAWLGVVLFWQNVIVQIAKYVFVQIAKCKLQPGWHWQSIDAWLSGCCPLLTKCICLNC